MNQSSKSNVANDFSLQISVYTEMPDTPVNNGFRGRVFYDADCAFCRGLLSRFGDVFTKRGFVFEPLQDAINSDKFDIPAKEFYREMKLLLADGRWLGGANAWIELLRNVWYLRPIVFAATLPGFNALAHTGYRYVAANRHCLNGACGVQKGTQS